jgi:penicillin-insensitive murein DD-endopeptidase
LRLFKCLLHLINLAAITHPISTQAATSLCVGSPASGQAREAVQLPLRGRNFSPYNTQAVALGRTYVHQQVRDVVVQAYQALETAAPTKVFVYGETGAKNGAAFAPHRSHQNGLSVDFMVPVFNTNDQSVPLPTTANNHFGYDLEFDPEASMKGFRIDFEALAEHLAQLHLATEQQGFGFGIDRVFFDPIYLPRLFATLRGTYLKKNIRFMSKQAWVRHDEHYHVDFKLKCL